MHAEQVGTVAHEAPCLSILSPGEYRRQALPLRKLNNATAHLVGVGARLDENGVGTILSDLGEDAIEIARAPDQHVPNLQAKSRCHAEEQLQRFGVLRIGGGDDGHAFCPRHDCLDQLESLGPQLLIEQRQSCDVSAWADKLVTKPARTGSPTPLMTMGILEVARLGPGGTSTTNPRRAHRKG